MSALRSFVIGSSLPAVAAFFYGVSEVPDDIRNFSYKRYSLMAPLYLGLVNVLIFTLVQKYKWPLRKTYAIVSIISGLLVPTYAKWIGVYNVDEDTWTRIRILVLLMHIFTFNIVIVNLESLL